MLQNRYEITTDICNFALQEAYSVARQFNLIPPVAEQAEYHLFQRDKVEMQMPELYHKIGIYIHIFTIFVVDCLIIILFSL